MFLLLGSPECWIVQWMLKQHVAKPALCGLMPAYTTSSDNDTFLKQCLDDHPASPANHHFVYRNLQESCAFTPLDQISRKRSTGKDITFVTFVPWLKWFKPASKVLQTRANLVPPQKNTSTLWSELVPLNFFTLTRLHPRSLTANAPEKMVVGRRSFPIGFWYFFRGELLNFGGVYHTN